MTETRALHSGSAALTRTRPAQHTVPAAEHAGNGRAKDQTPECIARRCAVLFIQIDPLESSNQTPHGIPGISVPENYAVDNGRLTRR